MSTRGLDTDELRELHPAELILECVGIKHAPRYAPATLDDLRAANGRFRSAGDVGTAAEADEDFHRRLATAAENPRLTETWEAVRRQLAPYKRVYLSDRARLSRSAAEHEAIIGALERGERRAAEARLRRYHAEVLARLVALLDGGPA
jgi:DNA-binding GntR family transcriptional regulator